MIKKGMLDSWYRSGQRSSNKGFFKAWRKKQRKARSIFERKHGRGSYDNPNIF